jgi:arsenate reductase-like glutaredoxin family protein
MIAMGITKKTISPLPHCQAIKNIQKWCNNAQQECPVVNYMEYGVSSQAAYVSCTPE